MALILTLFLKSLLLFALAGGVLLLGRRASASVRHLVCLLTLAALLALPVVSGVLPGWRVLPTPAQAAAPPATGRAGVQVVEAPAPQADAATIAPLTGSSAGTKSAASSAPTGSVPTLAPPLLGAGGLLAFYLSGLLLAAARPVLGLWGIAHLRRRCTDETNARILTAAAECAGLLGLPLPRLCRADVPVPMTWGWRRPVVLLPLTAGDWPEDRLRSVLLHEMAHIKRRDWAGHRFADFVCALYWFHPLVWLTARRLRTESELACDDLVLASGVAASEYARHLLEIAGALSRAAPPTQAAIAMAQTSKIEGRIMMILDKTRSRRAQTRRVLLIALVPATAALVTLAVLRPAVKAQTAPQAGQIEQAPLNVVPDSRTTLTMSDMKIHGQSLLAGVTDANKPGGPWWSATGALLPTPVYDTNASPSLHQGDPSKHTVALAFRLPAKAQDITVEYKLPDSTGFSTDGEWPGKSSADVGQTEAQLFARTQGTRLVTAQFPPSVKRTNVQVGIASGSWKMAAVNIHPADGMSTNDGDHEFLLSPVSVTPEGVGFSLASNVTDDMRIVAVTTQGQKVLPHDNSGSSINKMSQNTVHFNLPLSQIKEFRVETRPFQWIEYKNVALDPAK